MFQSTHPHGVRRFVGHGSSMPISFQSTHPHGVRLISDHWHCSTLCFNPRTHMGCDFPFISFFVSLHQFQSTHPHGVRRLRRNIYVRAAGFQSTHPHGVRHKRRIRTSKSKCFNPRTHMGCDTTDLTFISR